MCRARGAGTRELRRPPTALLTAVICLLTCTAADTGPIAFVVLVTMELCMQQETAGLYRFYLHKPNATLGIILGGCCLALMYNVVLMQSVRTFSSVGTAVLGNFRTVLLIFASAMILGELQSWGATR